MPILLAIRQRPACCRRLLPAQQGRPEPRPDKGPDERQYVASGNTRVAPTSLKTAAHCFAIAQTRNLGRLAVVAVPRTQSLGMHPWRRTLGPSIAPAPDGLLFGPDDVQVPRTAQRGAGWLFFRADLPSPRCCPATSAEGKPLNHGHAETLRPLCGREGQHGTGACAAPREGHTASDAAKHRTYPGRRPFSPVPDLRAHDRPMGHTRGYGTLRPA